MKETSTPVAGSPKDRLEAVTFTLGSEVYAININSVKELRQYEQVTRIVNAPNFILGVLNLRGVIVPVVDMRLKFNLQASYDDTTVTVVLNIGERIVGMVVDSVQDVIQLEPEQIKPAPAMGSALKTEYLMGLGTVGERMLILVDIEKLMSSHDMGVMEEAAAQAS